MEPYVFLGHYRGKPTLRVIYRSSEQTVNYPLTRAGCLRAGRDIFKAGAENWLNSSSVDFPQGIKPSCRLDVRALLGAGFEAAYEEHDRPRRLLIDKIMAWCHKKDFQVTLTPKEQALFDVLYKKVKEGG